METLFIGRKIQLCSTVHVLLFEVLRSFKSGAWTVVYVDSHETDEAFLFYAEEPFVSRYITLWSVAATTNEEAKVRDWTFKNAPNIPANLANCFAWYVTKNRK